MLAACLAVITSPAALLKLLSLLALDAGAELEARLELEELNLLEELELATTAIEELELTTAALLTWPPDPPLGELPPEEPPPQLGSTQAQSKQALKRL